MTRPFIDVWKNLYDPETSLVDNSRLLDEVMKEVAAGQFTFGEFNSWHELSAILREEFEEFWQTVKDDDPDPYELLQVIAVAWRGMLQLCTVAYLASQNEDDVH